MIVTRVDEHIGFGYMVANGAVIPSFTSFLSGVPTSAAGDVAITVDFLGDFETTTDGFTIDIEGFSTGLIQSAAEYRADTATFTINRATWAAIIADGTINISYNLGTDTQEGSLTHNAEEYIRLTFTWEMATTPSEPRPNYVHGTDGADWLPGTSGRDIIDGGAGNDVVFGRGDSDIINGGLGDDIIGGGNGNDTLRGDAGNDTIFGGAGNNSIEGGAGNDIAWGGAGNDELNGLAGADILGGGAGLDFLFGGDGDDVLYGGAGNDQLFGEAGNDRLFGGAGNDRLDGGLGDDILSGGAGADTFIFGRNEGKDVVRDFDAAEGDRIDLKGQAYTVSANSEGFATLEMSGGGSVTLDGIAVEEVSAGWFL